MASPSAAFDKSKHSAGNCNSYKHRTDKHRQPGVFKFEYIPYPRVVKSSGENNTEYGEEYVSDGMLRVLVILFIVAIAIVVAVAVVVIVVVVAVVVVVTIVITVIHELTSYKLCYKQCYKNNSIHRNRRVSNDLKVLVLFRCLVALYLDRYQCAQSAA